MRLSSVPNFRVEDFPSEQSWISRLFVQLNPFIQSVNQVLTQNIDFTYNIMSITKDYDLTVNNFQAFSFQWTFANVTPNELRVIKALKGSSLTPTILLAAWKYDSSNKTVTVTDMREVSGTSVAALSGRYQFSVRAMI